MARRTEVTPAQAAAVCRGESGRDYVRPVPRERRDLMPPSAPLLAGNGGLRLLMEIPGFVGLFTVEVPEKALYGELDAVLCTCGSATLLQVGVTECSGGCSRWFLRLADAVLVKRFDEHESVAA